MNGPNGKEKEKKSLFRIRTMGSFILASVRTLMQNP